MTSGVRHRTAKNASHSACQLAIAVAACQILCGCVSPLRTESEVASMGPHTSSLNLQAAQSVSNSLDSQRQVASAASLMHAGNLPAAQTLLVEILNAEPSNSSAVELLAEVSQKRGDLRLQQASLKRLITLQPGSATVANRCGNRLLNSVRMEASTNDTEAVGESKDSSAEQTTTLAIATLARAVELEPRNTLFVQDLFAALINQGMNERAEQILHEALQRNPRDKVLPMTAARLYESRSEWSSAVFYYDVALRNDPANPVWRRQRAVCHFRQGSFEKAQTDFSRSLAGSPVKPQLSEHLAWAEAALKTDDHEEAARVLELIVNEGELRTADIEVLRGTCLMKQGNLDAAAEVVLQAQLKWPKHAGLWQLSKQIKAAETGEPITRPDNISLDLASLMLPTRAL
jgi:Tfp pilus assembly protein PilF